MSDFSNTQYLKPVLILSRLSGILPLKGTLNTTKFSVSHFWILYNLFLSVLHIILSYFLGQYSSDLDSTSTDISNLAKIIAIYSSVAPSIIFILFLTLNRGYLIHCLHIISEVNVEISHIDLRLTNVKFSTGMYRKLVVGILLCVIVPSSATLNGSVLLPLMLFLQVTVLNTSVILFLTISKCIHQLFNCINLSLKSQTLTTILTIAKSQLYLMDATENLNKTFSAPLAHLSLTVFSGMIFTIFRGLQMLYKDSGADYQIFVRGVHIVYLTGLLAAMLHACHLVCDQANETGKNIHKLILTTCDSQLNQMLKMFSLQVLHCPVRFHAWGMFNFDYSLLLSLATAGTTYLVILVQFDQAKTNFVDNSCNNTCNV